MGRLSLGLGTESLEWLMPVRTHVAGTGTPLPGYSVRSIVGEPGWE
jgi:hypothetical protein